MDTGWWLIGEQAAADTYLSRQDDEYFQVVISKVGDGWRPTASSRCWPSIVVDGIYGAATWHWDPAGGPPGRTTTTILALVRELACSQGAPAADRVSEPVVTVRPDEVAIGFAVEPLPGQHDCEPGAPTPVLVTLPEPLGDRRLVDSGVYPNGDPRSSPPPPVVSVAELPVPVLPEPLAGRTTLLELAGASGEPVTRRRAPLPEGADELTVQVACKGAGRLALTLDGLAIKDACRGASLFAPSATRAFDLAVTATGAVRWTLRLSTFDFERNPVIEFAPPRARLRMVATDGEAVTAIGQPGCGWHWTPATGGGVSEQCGPSWQALPDDRSVTVQAGSELTVTLADGWRISGLSAAAAAHDRIIPSGNDPVANDLRPPGVETGDPATFAAPAEPGDWGLRVFIEGRNAADDTFSLPYYFRIHVTG